MILNSMVIENIRSYVHEEVEFSPGTSLFEGDIGSGKSTILMAIEFALFGLGSQKSESLLAKKEDAGYVILDFAVDGRNYEIKRALKKTSAGITQNPKESWLRADGTKEPLSPSELKQRVLEILKFNESPNPNTESRIFRYAVFTPQEAMKQVLSDADKRLDTIRKAFQIEEYSTARANAKDLLLEIKSRMSEMAGRFDNISEIESGIREAEGVINDADARIRKGREEQKAIESAIDGAKAVLAGLREKNTTRTLLESKINGTKDRISDKAALVRRMEQDVERDHGELDALGREHDKAAEISAPDTKMSEAEIASEIKKFQTIGVQRTQAGTEITSARDGLSGIRKDLGDMDLDIGPANDKLESMLALRQSCETRETEIKASLDHARNQQARMKAEMDRLEAEIGKFAGIGNRCPVCDQTVDEQHGHKMVDEKKGMLQELTEKLAPVAGMAGQLNSNMDKNSEQLRSCDREIPRMQESIRKIKKRDELLAKLPVLETKMKAFDESYSSFNGDDPIEALSELRDGLARHERALDEIRRISQSRQKITDAVTRNKNDIESARLQIAAWQEELGQSEAEFKALGDVADRMAQADTELDGFSDKRTAVLNMIAVDETTVRERNNSIERDRARLAESKGWKSRHGVFSQTHEWLEKFFIPTVASIEKQVLLEILHKFNTKYHELYSILVDDPTKESRIDENFTPMVEQDGYEQKIDYLSGGEKTSIALAYRLTLNMLVREEDAIRTGLLILDEPTDGFSDDQLAKVNDILNTLESEQIILVSHDRELETCADHVFRISKQDGISSILPK